MSKNLKPTDEEGMTLDEIVELEKTKPVLAAQMIAARNERLDRERAQEVGITPEESKELRCRALELTAEAKAHDRRKLETWLDDLERKGMSTKSITGLRQEALRTFKSGYSYEEFRDLLGEAVTKPKFS